MYFATTMAITIPNFMGEFCVRFNMAEVKLTVVFCLVKYIKQ
jgi:hypothetical protein